MTRFRGVRGWPRKAALATALIIWALNGLLSNVALLPRSGDGFLQFAHLCFQSASGEDTPQSNHHDCLSCVACNFKDASAAILAASQTSFDLSPGYFVLAAWLVTENSLTPRRRLIAQQPRAPPIFS